MTATLSLTDVLLFSLSGNGMDTTAQKPAAKPLILVVDDQEVMRKTLRDFLHFLFADWELTEAVNGQEALALCEQRRPALVLMDVMLPDANGIELTKSIRQQWPDTTVIVLSSHSESVFADLARDAGALAFVPKNSIASQLPALIQKLKSRK